MNRRVTVLIDRIVVRDAADLDHGALRRAVESELRHRLLEPGALDLLRSAHRAREVVRRPAHADPTGSMRPTADRLGATIAGATMEVVGP